ncbi:VIT and VWA domain-containing protein [Granulosicoccus sp.]|nr:VIT and VWA domain-containing protein [Granulosicoccus sp.]MDB4222727.1 VIT and VWA domain-containing protein [Granulosicoccus sp.]
MFKILINSEKTQFLKNMKAGLMVVAAALGLAASASISAAGLMTPSDGSPELVLAEQHVSVVVENGFSVTEVDQIFRNPYSVDKDAHYSFPVPEDAAVGEFTYWIDGQPVHAEVLEKKAARQLHEQQQQQGLETALVEQDEYRTFEMEVSPVRANQDVRVRLVYLQENRVDHAMGRYVYPLEDGGVDEQANSFWTRNETVNDAFTFQLRLRSSYPVDAMRVTNGQGAIQQISEGEWEVLIDSKTGSGASIGQGLSDSEVMIKLDEIEVVVTSNDAQHNKTPSGAAAYTLDKDIVVYWRLNENLPAAVDLVTYKTLDAVTGTFMLTVTPGIDLAPITEGRDWVFVLDTSGSMRGKFGTLIDGVERALKALDPADRFRIVLFSNSASSLSKTALPATVANIQATMKTLTEYSVGGGTNLYAGLTTGLKKMDQDRTTAVVLVTDGVANVGVTEMKEFLEIVEKADVRIFTAVLGNSANRPLLEALTKHAEGFAVNVSNDDDIVGLMMQVVSKVTHEAMHNINISIDGIKTRDLSSTDISRVYRGEQLIVMGKYSGAGPAVLRMTADISGETKRYESELEFANESTDNPGLERLWAFATIKLLQEKQNLLGETDDSRQGIIDLALRHGLVTNYTSLIAVRESAFEAAGIDLENSARIIRERDARKLRAQGDIKSARQDVETPMFTQKRSYPGNGGGRINRIRIVFSAAAFRGVPTKS